MALRIRRKHNINVTRVVAKVTGSVIALYVGGVLVTQLGNTMNCTDSPFYVGLRLIGWTVTSSVTPYTDGICNSTQWYGTTNVQTYSNVITAVNGSGVLSIN